jgi:hypothetical protein
MLFLVTRQRNLLSLTNIKATNTVTLTACSEKPLDSQEGEWQLAKLALFRALTGLRSWQLMVFTAGARGFSLQGWISLLLSVDNFKLSFSFFCFFFFFETKS